MVLTLVNDPSFSSISLTSLHLVTSLLLVRHSLSGCGHILNEIVTSIFNQWDCLSHVIDFVWELFVNEYANFYDVRTIHSLIPVLSYLYCRKCPTHVLYLYIDSLIHVPVVSLIPVL